MADELYGSEFPESWYALMPSRDLRRGRAVRCDALGRSLVAFRTASGRAAVLDRFCPHMGASLENGAVCGEILACPFHAWEFDADGRCTRIPYLPEDRIPHGARVDSLPVCEHLGFVWVYHGGAPRYVLPDLPEAGRRDHALRIRSKRFDVHPLLILENALDVRHFHVIHRLEFEDYELEVLREEKHDFEAALSHDIRLKLGPLSLRYHLRTTLHYPGASCIFGKLELDGRVHARFVAAPLPLGERSTLFHLLVVAPRLPLWLRVFDPLWQFVLMGNVFRGQTADYEKVWRNLDTTKRRVLVADDRYVQRFHRYFRSQLGSATGGSSPRQTGSAHDQSAVGAAR